MEDREDFENDEEPPTEPASDRVRIIGAQPAGAAAGPDGDSDATSEMSTGGLGMSDADHSAGTGADAGGVEERDSFSSPPEMPHWTDPPTGQVPAVLERPGGPGAAGRAAGDTGPAWREHEHEWDESGFDPSVLAEDTTTGLGALGEAPVEERRPWEFEDLGAAASRPGGATEQGAENGAPVADDAGWWDEDPDRRSSPIGGDIATAEAHGRETRRSSETRGTEGRGTENGDRSEPAPARTGAAALRTESGTAAMGADPSGSAEGPYGVGAAAPSSGALASISSSPIRIGRRSEHTGHLATGPTGTGGRFGPGPHEGEGDRSIPVAIATGLGFALVAVLCFKAGSVATLVLAAIVVTFAAAECYAALRRSGRRPATFLGLVGTVAVMVAAYTKGVAALPLVFVLVVVAALLWYLVGADRGSPVEGVASTVFGFAWIGLLGSFAALMLAPSQYPQRHGVAFLLGAVVATVGADVGALAVGSWIGRHPLAPRVSPHKTWEGLIGGAILAVALSAGVTGMVHPWTPGKAALLGVVAAVVAPLGDLAESMVKRDLGVKDMGSMLPGHGGVLDRVDAVLFVLPATYYLVRVLNLG